jgi:hypothetical protein
MDLFAAAELWPKLFSIDSEYNVISGAKSEVPASGSRMYRQSIVQRGEESCIQLCS